MANYAILQDGNLVSVTLEEWARWIEGNHNQVAWAEVGEVKVSTVFLGLDYGLGGSPLWFETLVFGGTLDREIERYETLEEAMEGHERMVARVKGSGE